MIPVLVSERNEPNAAKLKDCGWASGMMLAQKAGVRLPLGVTVAEREALERAQTVKAPETGTNITALLQAVHNRYGLQLKAYAHGTLAQKLASSTTTGFWIAADWHLMPEHYQRWDKAFAAHSPAMHAVYIEPRPAGQVWLMDPLAPWGYTGELAPASAILRASSGLSYTFVRQPAG